MQLRCLPPHLDLIRTPKNQARYAVWTFDNWQWTNYAQEVIMLAN